MSGGAGRHPAVSQIGNPSKFTGNKSLHHPTACAKYSGFYGNHHHSLTIAKI